MIEKSLCFGNIVIDLQNQTLSVAEKRCECEPKLFELLLFLCRNTNRALSRDELIEQVWHGRIVSDAAVNRAISQLRKLIEPEPSKPRYILTVSKIGYRFDAHVTTQQCHTRSPMRNINRTALIAVLICCCVFVFYSDSTIHKPKLAITNQTLISQYLNASFNPSFDKTSQLIYVLHKPSIKGNNQIYSLSQHGELEALTTDDFYYTDVISNGRTLYASRLNNLSQRHCELVSIDLKSHKISKLTDCGNSVITQLALDHHHRLIYSYRAESSAPYALYAIDSKTMRKEQLSPSTVKGNTLGHRIFTTKANQLVYIDYLSEQTDRLIIKDLDSGEILHDEPFIDNVLALSWWQDTLLISTESGIYTYHLQTKVLQQIEYSGQFGRMSVDGDRLFAERSTLISNLYLINETTNALTARQGSISLFTPARFSNQVIYLEKLNNKLSLKHIRQDHKLTTLKFDVPIKYVSNLAWSADDKKIAAVINDELYLYDFQLTQWQIIQHPFDAVHFVDFDNMNRLLVSAEYQKNWNIWRFNSKFDQPMQITHKGGYSFQLENQQIYYTKFSADGLFVRSLNEQKEYNLIADFPVINWRHWQLSGDHIIYKYNQQYYQLETISKNVSTITELKNYGDSSCRKWRAQQTYLCNLIDKQSTQIWQLTLQLD